MGHHGQFGRRLLWAIAILFGAVQAAGSQTANSQVPVAIYTYTTIDVPGAQRGSTTPTGINNLGEIVGWYLDSTNSQQGFLYDSGIFTNLGAGFLPTGINDLGDISGSDNGYVVPSTTLPNCPDCIVTAIVGINNTDEVVGYVDTAAAPNGQSFALLSDGWETACGSSTGAIVQAISNSGLIAGETQGDGAFVQDQGGDCTTYVFPGLSIPTDTTFYGINMWGLAVGYAGGNGGPNWSVPPSPFIYEWSELGEGNWAQIQFAFPSGQYPIHYANAVNDFGQIVGTYTDGSNIGHGYVTSGGLNVFMISAPPSSTTVTAGGSVTATINLHSVNNFTGSVMLSCSVSPASSGAPTCSFNPNPVVPPAGGSASSTLTINTTSASSALQSRERGGSPWHPTPLLSWPFAFGAMGIAVRCRKRTVFSLRFACLMFACAMCLSCGGGKGSAGSGNSGGGTNPGTYVVTVSAAGQTGQTTSVTLTVQ